MPLPLALGAVAALLASGRARCLGAAPASATGRHDSRNVASVTEPAEPVVPSEASGAASGSLRVVSEPAGAR